jgi:uncharacterized protein DUF6441
MAKVMEMTTDVSQIYGFSKAMVESPKVMAKQLATAYRQMGQYDIDSLRKNLPGKFNIRAKGLRNSFKYKATDPAKATDLTKLFADEYTGWKASAIFQTGGNVQGHGKQMTVLMDAARTPSGRRKYTQKQLRDMIANHQARFIPTARGALIVMDKGQGLTKKGKPRRGSRSIILAILVHSITQKKRLDFYENVLANDAAHRDFLETAVENALVEIATNKSK